MKKLIYKENDDQKVFFENEEQFSEWVSRQEKGTLRGHAPSRLLQIFEIKGVLSRGAIQS